MTQTTEQEIFMEIPTVEVEQTELSGRTLTLPVLSEGYFWRLKYEAGIYSHTIQIRKKFGPISFKIDERVVFANDKNGNALNPITNIESKAEGMMRTRLIEREQDKIMNGLLGDFKQAK